MKTSARTRWIAAVLGFFYFLGASFYSVVVPIWEGPDESFHYAYLRYIARNWRIPNAITEYGTHAWIATHAPLYYFVAAPFITSFDLSDESAYPLNNPQAASNDIDGIGNRNGYVHTSLEDWPYENGNIRALHVGRVINALFGSLTVICVVLLASRISSTIAIIAGVLTAFSPEFLFLGGLVQNDVPSAALAMLALLLALWYWEKPGKRNALIFGIGIGCAVLAKASNLGFLLLAGVLLIARRWKQWRLFFTEGIVLTLSIFVLCGWWLVLNFVRYGDPTGLAGSLVLMPGARVDYSMAENFFGLIRFTMISSWAMFGASSIIGPEWIYWVLTALTGLSLLGLAWFNRPEGSRPVIFLAVVWACIITFAGIFWELRVGSWHARHFITAIGAYSLLIAMGIEGWRTRFKYGSILLSLPIGSFTLALLAPVLIIEPAYQTPASVSALPDTATTVCIEYPDDGIELVAIDVEDEVAPGDILNATLFWRMNRQITYDLLQFIRILDGDSNPIASFNGYHGNGNWPTRLWEVGILYADEVRLQIPETARTPDLGRLMITLDRYGEESVSECAGRQTGTFVQVGAFRIITPSTTRSGSTILTLGDIVELRAVSWPEEVRAGEIVELELDWQVINPPGQPLSRFVHIEHEGNLIVQSDGIPAGFPASIWQAGDVLPDTVQLQLPNDAPTGVYTLLVGMYDEQGVRLPNDAPDDRAVLGTIEITP